MNIENYFSKKARSTTSTPSNNDNLSSQPDPLKGPKKDTIISVDTSNKDDLSLSQGTSKGPSGNSEITILKALDRENHIRPILVSYQKESLAMKNSRETLNRNGTTAETGWNTLRKLMRVFVSHADFILCIRILLS